MVFERSKNRIELSTIIFAIVALFVSSIFAFGLNFIQVGYAAAPSSCYTFYFTCQETESWSGDAVMETMYTYFDDDAKLAYSPNDYPDYIKKDENGAQYRFKGWRVEKLKSYYGTGDPLTAKVASVVDECASDRFELYQPTGPTSDLAYYIGVALWEKRYFNEEIIASDDESWTPLGTEGKGIVYSVFDYDNSYN